MGSEGTAETVRAELSGFIRQARAPRLRTMAQFAEAEIVLPDGPFEGTRYRLHRQPFNRLWFHAIDVLARQYNWSRFVAVGPTQSSKTLIGHVIPLLYHLFEVRESVISGLPIIEMSNDKWREVISPVIEKTAYIDEIPDSGAGSKGGEADAIKFQNGSTLKFMTGGGSDKSRAGYTARVVVISETDGMDKPGEASRETDKISQIEARTMAFEERRRIYLECTASIETGRIWQELKTVGTDSRIVCQCPHCLQPVTPEREHLTGWQDAETLQQAQERAAFCCPSCGAAFDEAQRRTMNEGAILVHRGQEVATVDGKMVVTGEPTYTDTFAMRWNAFNNLFVRPGFVASNEWKAVRAADPEDAERKLRQFFWALPHAPVSLAVTKLDAAAIRHRMEKYPRGMIPKDTQYVTIGVDLRKFYGHYVCYAWRPGPRVLIFDYGIFDINSDQFGPERAMLLALREFREQCQAGWTMEGVGPRMPDQVWIDSRYQHEGQVVYAFCSESREPAGERFRPIMGYGDGPQWGRKYFAPKSLTAATQHIGDGYHIVYLKNENIWRVDIHADEWKQRIQSRLACTVDTPGALTLFHAQANEHTKISKHFVAEELREEFKPGIGTVRKMVTISRENHFLDCAYIGAAAGHFLGVRLIPEEIETITAVETGSRQAGGDMTMPDGRPIRVWERR